MSKLLNYPLHTGECTLNFLITTRELCEAMQDETAKGLPNTDELDKISDEVEKVFSHCEIEFNHTCNFGLEIGINCPNDDKTIESNKKLWKALCERFKVRELERYSDEHRKLSFD